MSSMSDLEDFALECIHSSNYPDDDHIFSFLTCDSCGMSSFRVTIEHHTGSKEWDFKGIIWGYCSICGNLVRLFTYTAEHRKPLRDERPECECTGKIFYVGLCERIEGEKGLKGFFDEGVIVGKCTSCQLNRVFVYTD